MTMRNMVVAFTGALAVAACSGGGDAGNDAGRPDDTTSVSADPELPDLKELLSTANAAECVWLGAAGTKALLEDSFIMAGDIPVAGPALTLPGVPMPVEPSIIAPEEEFAPFGVRLNFEGRWLGLTVTGMSYWFVPRSDWQYTNLHFADPVEDVVAALGGAGFPVNADGSTRRITLEEGGAMYDYWGLVSNISREADETIFQCNEDGWDEGD